MTDRRRDPRPPNTNPWPGAGEPSAGSYQAADGSISYEAAPLIAYYGPDGQVSYHPAPAGLTAPQDEGLPPDPGWAALREAVWESGQAQPYQAQPYTWPEGPAWGDNGGGAAPADPDPVEPAAVVAPADIETPDPATSAAPDPDPAPSGAARAETELQPIAAPTELTLPPPLDPELATTLTVPVAAISGAKTAAHKVVPRPTAAHRISTERAREDPEFRPSQVPYRIGVGRRMRSGFALVLISVVVAGLLTAALLALVAGIASTISHAASN